MNQPTVEQENQDAEETHQEEYSIATQVVFLLTIGAVVSVIVLLLWKP